MNTLLIFIGAAGAFNMGTKYGMYYTAMTTILLIPALVFKVKTMLLERDQKVRTEIHNRYNNSLKTFIDEQTRK